MTTSLGIPPSGRLVGREVELARLALAGVELLGGRGSILAVEGDAGMGKTALLAAHVADLAAAGCRVAWVRANEVDQIRPFGSLLDALDCRLQHPEPSHRRVAQTMVAGAHRPLDRAGIDVDGAWRFPIQDSLVDLLVERSLTGPAMLVIDDIQWADTGTLGVVQALARRTASEQLAVVWAQRSGWSIDVCERIANRHGDRFERLELQPLAPDAIRDLAAVLFDHAPETVELERLEPAGGNPFFITAAAHVGATETLTSPVLDWVGQIPDDATDILSIAAVVGGEFDLRTVAQLTDRPVPELVEALEPAVQRGLLIRFAGGSYNFAHDLIRVAVLENLPGSLRAPLHRDLSDVLEADGADPSLTALHVLLGARRGDDPAAERVRALCEAVVHRDADTAADLLERAAALCAPGSATWVSTTADRVVALQWAGHAAASLALADAASAHPVTPAEAVRLRLVRAASLGLLNDVTGAAEVLQGIVDEPGLREDLRARVLAELATLDAWGVDRRRARENITEAIAVAGRAGALRAELQALCARSTLELFDGDVHDAAATARQAVERGRDFVGVEPARELYLALALANADERDESEIWFMSGQAAAQDASDLWMVSRYQLARMSVRLNSGEWDELVADAEAVIALHEDTGMGTGMPQAPATAGIVAVRRGASDDDVARYGQLVVAHSSDAAEPSGLLYAAWFEALVAEREGRTDDAAATATFLDAAVRETAPLTQLWIGTDVVRLLLAAGDDAGAAEVTDTLDELSGRVGTRSARGTTLLCRGLIAAVSDAPDASRLLAEARDLLTIAAWRPGILTALEALSRCGATSGDRELERLRGDLSVVGAGGTDMETRGRGDARSARALDPLVALTATEHKVARLAADGMANPAIAVALGVSKRTVEYHISNLYAKTGVTNRVALAALLR